MDVDCKTEEQHESTQKSEQASTSIDDDNDGITCPLCLDEWTSCGPHRLCSLKCGHLFGLQCVTRWLDSQPNRTCPTCKKRAKRTDVRVLYAKKLVAVDTSELESIKQQLAQAVTEKNTAIEYTSRHISQINVLQMEIERLKKKIMDLTLNGSAVDHARKPQLTPSNRIRLYLEKNIDVCSDSMCTDCRSFDVSVSQDTILIGSKSPNNIFGGYGLKKFVLKDYRPVKFIPLHMGPIRDLCIHPTEKRVLTVSIDRKVKITALDGTNAILTSCLDSAAWACAWSNKTSTDFTIGTQNGAVSVFDIRNVTSPKITAVIPDDYGPVIAVANVPALSSTSELLLVAKLNSVWAFECHSDGTFNRHLLPLDGPFMSLRYDEKSEHLLVTARPNGKKPYTRHTVCSLEKKSDPDVITSNIVHAFRGGSVSKLLARTSCFVPNNIVAGYHESRKNILLYSLNTGEEVGSCPTHDNMVLDVMGLDTGDSKFLFCLNEKKMEVFKFNS